MNNPLHCSFCGRSRHDVLRLIAGPAVFICDVCIDRCTNIVRDARALRDAREEVAAAVRRIAAGRYVV